jgi:hypothetical protein
MHLTLIKNPDDGRAAAYKLARVIYAETGARSLAAVEGLASMIRNLCIASKRELTDIAGDKNIFECLHDASPRHDALLIDANARPFGICLRVVMRMMRGDLPDSVDSATQFHHADAVPDWAVARGYVADVDGLLFYRGERRG